MMWHCSAAAPPNHCRSPERVCAGPPPPPPGAPFTPLPTAPPRPRPGPRPGGSRRERRRDDDLDVRHVLHQLPELLHEHDRLVDGLVHLPVGGDERRSHSDYAVLRVLTVLQVPTVLVPRVLTMLTVPC